MKKNIMMKNIGKTHFDFSEFTGAFSKEISISFLEWFVGFLKEMVHL